MATLLEQQEEGRVHLVVTSDEERRLLFPEKVACCDVWEPLKAFGIDSGPNGTVHLHEDRVEVEFPNWKPDMKGMQFFQDLLIVGEEHVTSLARVVIPECGRCPPRVQVVFNPVEVWKLQWKEVIFQYGWVPLK